MTGIILHANKKAESQQPNIITVTVNPIINNQPTNTCNPSSTQTVSQEASQSTNQTITQTITHYFKASITWPHLSNIKIPFDELSKQSKAILKKHKKEIIFGGAAFTYLFICYLLIRGNNYLGRLDIWSSWKVDISLYNLYAIPHEKISRELLIEIQKRYTRSDKPTDFMLPIINFLYDIDKEITQLNFYRKLYVWLKRLRLHYIMPLNTQRFMSIKERLKRTLFIKNIFLTWAAHYKIEHNKTVVLDKIRRLRPELAC